MATHPDELKRPISTPLADALAEDDRLLELSVTRRQKEIEAIKRARTQGTRRATLIWRYGADLVNHVWAE